MKLYEEPFRKIQSGKKTVDFFERGFEAYLTHLDIKEE